jgi:transglutaminase/protease-like cytokinesis protein 3
VCKRTKAQWNAVLIEGEWRLVDLFWASTCVELNSGDAKKIYQQKKKNQEKENQGKENQGNDISSNPDEDDNYDI